MKISSWNEWDPLKSVVIGISDFAQVPRDDRSLRAINYAHLPEDQAIHTGPYPEQVLQEASEDLEQLTRTLTQLGVEVHRPEIQDWTKSFSSPDWQTDGYYSYCPRDSVLIHGDLIIESPMPLRARQYETQAMKPLFLEAMKQGARWISAPKPALKDECFELEGITKDKLTLNESEPCFDAANILRAGRDLFYLVSNSGNKLGAQWLQNLLGSDFRVHTIENMYSYMHLDSTISLLRPGLVLLNPERVNQDNLPEPLKKWDHIWCPPPVDIGHHPHYPHASAWVGMNLLMVNPELALVEQSQTQLRRELEKHGIETIGLPIRQARTLGGAFHCVSLDLWREGALESYF